MTSDDVPRADDFADFDGFLREFDRMLELDASAALRLVDAALPAIRGQGEWTICRAEALRMVAGPAPAADYLADVVAADPEFSDAHYYLAGLYGDLGRKHEAVNHHLETLRLDSEIDLVSEMPSAGLEARIVSEATQALLTLPADLLRKFEAIPVLLSMRPTEEMVRAGLDSRALGTFEGPNLSEIDAVETPTVPTVVTLFTHCLMQAFGLEEEELLEQVRVTVAHEVGHFFGLDDAELAEIGLE